MKYHYFLVNCLLALCSFVSIKAIAQTPVITSFTPAAGSVGTVVTITGSGFNPVASNNIVSFGATRATVTASSTNSLTVSLPPGSTFQPVTVTTNNLTAFSKAPFITTANCGQGTGELSFLPKKDYPLSNTYANALIDIDADGKPDIITANSTAVSIFKNNSTSQNLSFNNELSLDVQGISFTIAVSDLDGDGKPDIAVANFHGNKLLIFKNTSFNGKISFASRQEFFTGMNPYGVAIADINADGKPDIIFSNQNSSPATISIYKNISANGNISLSDKVDLPAGSSPGGISTRDLNFDGLPEIIVANQKSQSISVFKNTSVGSSVSFENKTDYAMPAGSSPESIAIGDFDNDLMPEIAVTNNNAPGTISILKNTSSQGTISFANRTDIPTGANPYGIAISDIDGDGKPDIAVTAQRGNSVSVLKNIGNSAIAFAAQVEFSTGDYPQNISIGDLDGDEKPDLIVGNSEATYFSVLQNAAAVFLPSINITTPSTTTCAGTSVTFTATATGVQNPGYQWKLNGANVSSNNNLFTLRDIKDNDIILCQLTGTSSCSANATVTSNTIKMTVNPSPVISISGDTCLGSILSLTDNTPSTSISWKLNGAGVLTSTAGIQPNAVTVAGGNGPGTNTNQLNNPNRIYMDASGNIYIPDMTNSRIMKWAPGATSGVLVAGGNETGDQQTQFNRATSVSMDSKGNLYIADQSNSRIQKWTPGAASGETFASGLSSPTGIFIDANDNIYVSQQNSSLVTKYPTGSATGVTVAGGNGWGSAANQLSSPTGISVDTDGNIYICDTDNDRVQKWAPGATSGVTVAGGNGYGSGLNQLANPLGIFVDSYKNTYISDYNNARVQKWEPGATSGTTIAGGNGTGTGSNQLNRPAGIWVDANGNLFVSDFFNARVQKFPNTLTKTYTTANAGAYTATVTSSNGCTATSNSINIVAPKTPEVSVKANLTGVCAGNMVVITASPVNGGTEPLFQWQINGNNAGNNTRETTFTSTSLRAGDYVSCIMTSNATSCLSSNTAVSNNVFLTTASPEKASVTITASDTVICPASVVTFRAASTNGGNNPVFNWKINGVNTGSNTSQITLATLQDGDIVTCQVTSSLQLCPANSTATSNKITIHTIPVPAISNTISVNDSVICTGSTVRFAAIAANAGISPTYQWKLNGNNTGINSPTYTSNSFKDGDIILCTIKSDNQCQLSPLSSNAIRMTVDLIPVITTQKDTIIFLGSSLTLKTTISVNAATYLWTPSATLNNAAIASPVARPIVTTTYQLQVTTPGECKAYARVTITPITEVTIPSAFSPNNDGINDVWNIAGLSTYNDANLEVFNRYGALMFRSKGYNTPWNGTYNGKPLPVGTYYYVITGSKTLGTRSGNVTILK